MAPEGDTLEKPEPTVGDQEAVSPRSVGSDRTLEPGDGEANHADGSPMFCGSNLDFSTEISAAYQYKCPHCSFLSASLQDALAHCDGKEAKRSTTSGADDGVPAKEAATVIGAMDSTVLESVLVRNELGEPVLVIRKNFATGRQTTVVKNPDGSEKAFGQSTVESLVANTEDTTLSWLKSLSVTELKGLLNEVNNHVAEGSRLYHQTKSEVDQMSLKANYSYFGLTEDASEKELDNAYRQLAKRMHPDKNGGTAEANVKFQRMKEQYEALKQQRGERHGGCPQVDKENRENHGEDTEATPDAGPEPGNKADGENAEGQKSQQPSLADLLMEMDRGPLDEAALQMLSMLKVINANMSLLRSEQEKLATHLSA